MNPVKLTPVFRSGADTPWGGGRLRTLYQKPAPDPHTGESLEASVLPGLESLMPDGRSLGEWVREHGPALCGTDMGSSFPLLLKLIDARERLSVQVHPGDAYAARHEGGKRGKTEAWVILDAPPDASLVYGVRPGITRQALTAAAGQGKAVEDCLRWVDVQPGDVLYIPAGMIHAIGADIVLYEIQQSSDVTYRFWDWDRRDPAGRPRELHLQKALDVADVSLQLGKCTGESSRVTGGTSTRLIQDANFSLHRLDVKKAMPLEEMPRRFRLLTALCEGYAAFAGGVISFHPGDTLLIPAQSPRVKLECEGALLLAAPMQP